MIVIKENRIDGSLVVDVCVGYFRSVRILSVYEGKTRLMRYMVSSLSRYIS